MLKKWSKLVKKLKTLEGKCFSRCLMNFWKKYFFENFQPFFVFQIFSNFGGFCKAVGGRKGVGGGDGNIFDYFWCFWYDFLLKINKYVYAYYPGVIIFMYAPSGALQMRFVRVWRFSPMIYNDFTMICNDLQWFDISKNIKVLFLLSNHCKSL